MLLCIRLADGQTGPKEGVGHEACVGETTRETIILGSREYIEKTHVRLSHWGSNSNLKSNV